jgi:hypothetical protein
MDLFAVRGHHEEAYLAAAPETIQPIDRAMLEPDRAYPFDLERGRKRFIGSLWHLPPESAFA